jgi:hypothetical protein
MALNLTPKRLGTEKYIKLNCKMSGVPLMMETMRSTKNMHILLTLLNRSIDSSEPTVTPTKKLPASSGIVTANPSPIHRKLK